MLVNEFTPVSGGAEKQAERLAGYFAARNRPVWVITRQFPGLATTETMNGFHVIRPSTWGPGKTRTITFVLGALRQLWLLRHQIAIIHAHMLFGPAFAAALAGRLLGKRVIVKLGSSGPTGEIQISQRTFRGRLRLALLRRWADVIIALDDDMQAEALSAGFLSERIYRMVNGIDVSSFAPALPRDLAKSKLQVQDRVLILFVGRLVPQKSLPTLLKALRQAVKICPNLHLILVGSGSEQANLQNVVNELRIDEFVTFAGNQSDVKPYLNAADIFVLPSESEGMSNALMEGMAAGLACIATPVGASAKMLGQGKYGILIPVGDVTAWAEALIGLALDPIRREELGRIARQRVMAEYDFSVVGARYEALYQDLIKLGIN
ncbi:MAG TPA: glycosyltransferase family 4 protein [Anaerolineales bacterium]|nr:glycosyltransferase family 4 protein [Anaerolineales bacterium]